ncbi:MAG: S8 family serine peptidase [Saprospiraceae bacterium]
MKNRFGLFVCLVLSMPAFAQIGNKPAKYWVEFTDKNDSPFCTCRPAEFLSARAIDRRARAGIAVVENDLPVNPAYLEKLKATGAKIHHTSRWLNAATLLTDSTTAAQIATFPFVKKVEYIGWHIKPRNKPNPPLKTRKPLATSPKAEGGDPVFGYATMQNSMLGTHFLYHLGCRGEGIWVAVMDGGFTNVDALPFFDSSATHNRLFSGWDFVERDQYVFEDAAHGTSVLSVMAANIPGYFVGTAPDATYFCLKTEDVGGELPVEEANWIAGAEWADSIGVDIINASLGYTVFSDTSLGHRYLQLDGRTAIGSRGATIAATKGMLICNSAGNSGDEPWHYIGVPADAPGVIAVGAADFEGRRASFSSFGPTADGRIKPDLAAPGEMLITATTNGTDLGYSSGTSVASPMLVGGLAALWSAFPEKTAAEISDAAFASADQIFRPDNALGYGIPNLAFAYLRLGGYFDGLLLNDAKAVNTVFSFARSRGELSILAVGNDFKNTHEVVLRNALGQEFRPKSLKISQQRFQVLTLSGLENLPPGAYSVTLLREQSAARLFSIAF